MEIIHKKKMGRKILLFAGGVALTVVGFIVISPFLKKYGNKLYKKSLKNDNIDFDNMGPEIVGKETKEEE